MPNTTTTTGTPERARKTTRRLRPEVASALTERKRQAELDELYGKPVQELEPEELARMRAAFFRG